MTTVEIWYKDLTLEKQKEILDDLGVDDPAEMGWDENPMAVLEVDDEDENSDEG